MKNIPIGEVLKEKGYITEEQLQAALVYQKANPDSSKRLGAVLIDQGFVTERQILSALCEKLEMQIIPLEMYPIDMSAVARIPRALAAKYCLLAISQENGRLTVAINDPLNFYGIEDVRQITGMPIDIVLAEKAKIDRQIEILYSEIEARKAAADMKVENAAEVLFDIDGLDDTDETPIIKLLNSILLHGYNIGASDIHIEPMERETRVRLRVDGMLIHYMVLNYSLHLPIVARIKILSNLDITEKRSPQDGHFVSHIEGVEMNLRVSSVPTIYGEKIVLRYLNTSSEIKRANHFGMNDQNFEKFSHMLGNPNGIVYITGPTGSGKTTTLYMALEELVKRQVNISTIEDPVERRIHGINQLQVNPIAGLTFERGLRALLRQDPDIMMVGETRDNETASISVRSAITGHLVLSTLHTNNAVSSIIRLEDMGIESYLVANSLVGLVAQRLVRMVCPYCGEEYTPNEQEIAALSGRTGTLVRGKGCPACNHTGYKGRMAIHEVVVVDQTIRRMITKHSPEDEIDAYIREHQHFTSLVEEAQELVLAGVTTTEELMKLTYYVD